MFVLRYSYKKPILVDGPYTFDLVEGNSKENIFNIKPLSVKPWLGGDKLVAEWLVPDNNLSLSSGYRVRVSSGNTNGYSKIFWVSGGEEIDTPEIDFSTSHIDR